MPEWLGREEGGGVGVRATDAQVRKLMKEHARHGSGASVPGSGTEQEHRAKYLKSGQLPSEQRLPEIGALGRTRSKLTGTR